MTTDRHLTWDVFDETFLRPGVPCLHQIPGTPRVDIVVDAGRGRIALRCPGVISELIVRSPTAAITISRTVLGDESFVEVATQEGALFKSFYSLIVDIADRIQEEAQTLDDALKSALRNWNRLLQRPQRLSTEEEIGLWGELYFLRSLIDVHGDAAVASWVGPLGEMHDFRAGSVELELKTTLSSSRNHLINGLSQLASSPGCMLALVSVQVRRAGAGGQTLPDLVKDTLSRLKSVTARESAERLVEQAGLRLVDQGEFIEAFDLRAGVGVVLIDESAPRLTREVLATAIDESLLALIGDVHYRVSLDSKVSLAGEATFERIIGEFRRGIPGGR
jgi:hypothetical protein